jgi:hypothetical protein
MSGNFERLGPFYWSDEPKMHGCITDSEGEFMLNPIGGEIDKLTKKYALFVYQASIAETLRFSLFAIY